MLNQSLYGSSLTLSVTLSLGISDVKEEHSNVGQKQQPFNGIGSKLRKFWAFQASTDCVIRGSHGREWGLWQSKALIYCLSRFGGQDPGTNLTQPGWAPAGLAHRARKPAPGAPDKDRAVKHQVLCSSHNNSVFKGLWIKFLLLISPVFPCTGQCPLSITGGSRQQCQSAPTSFKEILIVITV